jgi:hypothetical protein
VLVETLLSMAAAREAAREAAASFGRTTAAVA